jgi:hypothetical protein
MGGRPIGLSDEKGLEALLNEALEYPNWRGQLPIIGIHHKNYAGTRPANKERNQDAGY